MCFACSICFESLIDIPNNAASIGCGHMYHTSCLNKWLSINNLCPICRSKVRNIRQLRLKDLRDILDENIDEIMEINTLQMRFRERLTAQRNRVVEFKQHTEGITRYELDPDHDDIILQRVSLFLYSHRITHFRIHILELVHWENYICCSGASKKQHKIAVFRLRLKNIKACFI